MYVGKRERNSATGLLSDVFLMAKEMFWNLKRFTRITGIPLSILDNYSVRPTSEGQITSVWGKKKPECVKNRKWCLTQTFASGFPQSQGLYLLGGCFEGPGDGALGSWFWTWPDSNLEFHLGLDSEKRTDSDSNFYSDDRLWQQPPSSVTEVWLLVSTHIPLWVFSCVSHRFVS